MEWLWAAVGWLAGWALNAPAYELPRSQEIFAWPRCGGCGRRVGPWQLSALPVRGAGRCAGCETKLLPRAFGLEVPAALVFGALAWRYGPSATTLVYSVWAVFLLLTLAIDLRHRWVYGVVCYPGTLLALLLSPLAGYGLVSALLGALVGGGIFLALYGLGRLLYRGVEPMGSGDVTIAAMIGTMVGVQRVLPALFLGGVIVAVASLVLLAARRAGGRTYVPYGAGLCAGALAVLVLLDAS